MVATSPAMTAAAMAAAAAARRVCFLTDIEGNWRYVRNVVRQSTCLHFSPRLPQESTGALPDGDLELRDDCFLVFGGDAGDKGGETLQCYEQLVRLKKKYPDRVVLLVGNRDVNKMRLTSELDDSEMDLRAMAKDVRDGPTWVPLAKRVTLPMYLANEATRCSSADAGGQTEQTVDAANTKVARLKWMLEHTMGAQGDFERRRLELQTRRPSSAAGVADDAAVLQSYIDSVHAGGVLREYLELGSLAFIARDTLFVHGGVVSSGESWALGRVPGAPGAQPQVYESVHEWVDALNTWYAGQVREWIDQPVWTSDHRSRGGHELLEYVLPGYDASVVMGRHLEPSGMPRPLPHDMAATLAASGITRLVVGHTPHGNCPTVIKQPPPQSTSSSARTFEEVIMCDTSYSSMAADDNRGDAASELVLERDSRVHIHGVLEDKRRIAYRTDDPLIGRKLHDGTFVKAKLAPDGSGDRSAYVVCAVTNGFSYAYHDRAQDEIEAIGVVE